MNRCPVVAILSAALAASAACAFAESPEGAQAAASERTLAAMRQRAERAKIISFAGEREGPVELVAEPFVRYSDQPRTIADGTMWAFGKPGRPEAMLKVEAYRRDDGALVWLYSMGSLAEGLLEAEWGDGHRWRSKAPGLVWQTLSAAPTPKETTAGRLRQLKDLARRFTARAFDPGRGKEELRLLTQPIHRYADADSGVVDAAIFGFASYGTNPSLLLSIELRTEAAGPVWHFAPARMSDAGLEVRLDEQSVWTAPASSVGPVELDAWLYFWEAPAGPGN